MKKSRINSAAVSRSNRTPGLRFAQAPVNGIPARVGATPGQAPCECIVLAPQDGTGYSKGDLVRNGVTITVLNWVTEVIGDEGDRLIVVDSHQPVTFVAVEQCQNDGDPNDFETLSSQSGGASV